MGACPAFTAVGKISGRPCHDVPGFGTLWRFSDQISFLAGVNVPWHCYFQGWSAYLIRESEVISSDCDGVCI